MSPRRTKMPVFDENAPLPTHLPKPSPILTEDTDGFLVPAIPAPTRLRPLSINTGTGKKVIPKHRGGSVSLSKGTSGVLGIRREANSSRDIGEDSFLGDVSMLSGIEGEKREDGLGKLDKRMRAVEVGLKTRSKKTEQRFQSIEATIADIRTDLLLRNQPPSSAIINPASPNGVISKATALQSSIPFPDPPLRLPTAKRVSSEFGGYSSAGFGSPPVPALLSKRRKEMAMRRMSGLRGEIDEMSVGDISLFQVETPMNHGEEAGTIQRDMEVRETVELFEAETSPGSEDGKDVEIDSIEQRARSAESQLTTPLIGSASTLIPSEDDTGVCPPPTTADSSEVRAERDGKEIKDELEHLQKLVKVLQSRVDQQDMVMSHMQEHITSLGSGKSATEGTIPRSFKYVSTLMILVITFLALSYCTSDIPLDFLLNSL